MKLNAATTYFSGESQSNLHLSTCRQGMGNCCSHRFVNKSTWPPQMDSHEGDAKQKERKYVRIKHRKEQDVKRN